MTRPDYSVVIPFYNRREEVARCLTSVFAQKLPAGETFEVIAVDNGSTDGAPEEIQRFPVRFVECRTPGPAAARNAGVAATRAPIVAFMDSDCVAQPHWLRRVVRPLRAGAADITGGRITALHMRTAATWASQALGILDNARFFRGSPGHPPFFATANAALRKELFEQLGGFDERLRVGEDADLCWRALDAGATLAYVPGAGMRHAFRETIPEFVRQAVQYGAGSVEVFVKHRARFGGRAPVDWQLLSLVAGAPGAIAWQLVFGVGNRPWKLEVLRLLWCSGVLLGRVRGGLRRGVLYL